MCRLKFIFFFILFLVIDVSSQSNKSYVQLLADSLKNNYLPETSIQRLSKKGLLLLQNEKGSSDKIIYYYFLHTNLQFETDNEEAVKLINHELKKILQSTLKEKDSLCAKFLLLRSEFEDLENAKKTISIAKTICVNKNIALDFYYNLYHLYSFNNYLNHDSLFIWIDRSISISKINNDSSNIGSGYQTKAKIYSFKKDYYNACLNYYTALKYYMRKNFERALITNNLSILLSEIESFDEASKYAYESLICTKYFPLFNALANTTMAELFLYQKKYDSIYQYSSKAIKIAEQLENSDEIISKNTFYIGIYYYHNNNIDLAASKFDFSKRNSKNVNLIFYNDIYLSKIEVIKKNYANAKEKLNQYTNLNYKNDNSIQLNNNIANYYKLFSELEECLGNLNLSIKYLKIYNNIKDSINILAITNKINSAKISFELNKQREESELKFNYERQNLILKNSFTKKRFIYIIILSISTIFIFVIIAFFYIITKKRIAKNRANEAKYKLLKTQLNSHFVSNAMSTIQGYILNNDRIIACNYLSDYSKLTRLIFEKSSEDFIPISEEITILKIFFELQKLRFPEKFNYEVIYSDICIESILIPPMLIQPLIENCIEHNNWLNNEGVIIINFKIIDRYSISISVSDNGWGTTSNIENKKKTSLSVINDKINSLNATYRKKNYILFENNINRGLIVNLKVPYKSYD